MRCRSALNCDVAPQNREVTWSGRGRKPAWLAEEIAAGKKLEDFAI
ncbi:H-NS family nucleoid-associated regulatory protein [Alloyangia pacifica]|nr:H-NS family nucleoid-associated regulatory protein [Alloyangia pacifica]